MAEERTRRSRRAIVKIGSGCLTATVAGRVEVDRNTLFRLAADMSRAASQGDGADLVVVSSGAVALGVEALGLDARPTELADVQAMAAVGQSLLMSLWRDAFGRTGRQVGQVLLTHSDLADRQRYLNVRATLEKLLERGVVPVINENDTVMTDEITVGDNDRLATQVAKLLGASHLLLLSTVPGLLDPSGAVVPQVKPDDRPEEHLQNTKSAMGRGGMGSKLNAARAATHGGVEVTIASGRQPSIVEDVLAGRPVGTRFVPDKKALSSRKHWIAYTLKPHGTLHLDPGATQAVESSGASVLAVGIALVVGTFAAGEVVSLVGSHGRELGRGLVRSGSDDLRAVLLARAERPGQPAGTAPVIHRDDLVVFQAP